MRGRITRAEAAFAASLVLWTLACSSQPDGPEQAVQTFYRYLNEGDYADAMALHSEEALRSFDETGVAGQRDFATWAEAETKRSSISRVKVVDSRAESNRARVAFELRYRDGSSTRRTVELTLEEDVWRLGLIG